MNYRHSFIAFLFCTWVHLQAQDKLELVGVVAGMNTAWAVREDPSFESSPKIGFSVGALFQRSQSKNFFWDIKLLASFNQATYKHTSTSLTPGYFETFKGKQQAGFIELPVMLAFRLEKLGVKHVKAGLFLAYGFWAHTQNTLHQVQLDNIHDAEFSGNNYHVFEFPDIGFAGGIELNLIKSLHLEATYNHGFREIAPEWKIKRSVISLLCVWRF